MITDLLNEAIRQAVRRPEVLEILSNALEEQVRQQFGGLQHRYIAKQSNRAARAERISAEFTGNNLEDLAKKHGLTVRRIRQIVNSRKPKSPEK